MEIGYYTVKSGSLAPCIAPGVYRIQLEEDGYIRFDAGGKWLEKGKYTIVLDNFNEYQIRQFIPN
jgi:hypothetical protein